MRGGFSGFSVAFAVLGLGLVDDRAVCLAF